MINVVEWLVIVSRLVMRVVISSAFIIIALLVKITPLMRALFVYFYTVSGLAKLCLGLGFMFRA